MSNLANIEPDQQSFDLLVEQWLKAESEGELFPVDFDVAWRLAGYFDKATGKRKLTNKSSYLIINEDYIINKGKTLFDKSAESGLQGRSSDLIKLTCDAFKQFCLMAKTEQGRQIRQYFIEAEKKWKLVEKHHPAIASEIEVLQLQAEISRNQRYIMERSEFILETHGAELVALVQGRPNAIVHTKTTVTEVVNPQTGTKQEILTANQLKRAVKDRTGQNLPSMKFFTDAIRQEGRHDLLSPVERSRVDDYIAPDNLNEAIAVVYGKTRQRLLGE